MKNPAGESFVLTQRYPDPEQRAIETGGRLPLGSASRP